MSAHVETVGDAAGVRAMWQSPEGAEESVRLWRSTRGYAAEFRAPSVPGRYRLVVTHPTAAARAEFLVVEPAQQSAPVPDDDGRLAAFASSRGGKVIPMADVETLPSRLASAMPPTLATRPSHVMRSPWWMVPFAMLLAVEWSSRRRRGAR